jgi:hypothetical protein
MTFIDENDPINLSRKLNENYWQNRTLLENKKRGTKNSMKVKFCVATYLKLRHTVPSQNNLQEIAFQFIDYESATLLPDHLKLAYYDFYVKNQPYIVLQYHDTDVMTMYPLKTVYRTGGWHTKMTSRKINAPEAVLFRRRGQMMWLKKIPYLTKTGKLLNKRITERFEECDFTDETTGKLHRLDGKRIFQG